MELQNFAGNDQANHRVYELDNGNKLHLRRRDPYGFVHINLDKGQLPAWIGDNAFTDWSSARQAAEKYIRERELAITEILEAQPPLKPKVHK